MSLTAETVNNFRAPYPHAVHLAGYGNTLFGDESCLLVGVVERDEAERIAPNETARTLGGGADGLRNPRPPAPLAGGLQPGLY